MLETPKARLKELRMMMAICRSSQEVGCGQCNGTLRHSYASVAGDLGFTEITISALLGHTAGNATQRYVHHLDSVLIAAADKVSGEVYRMMTTDLVEAEK